jgi:hypothetical protein
MGTSLSVFVVSTSLGVLLTVVALRGGGGAGRPKSASATWGDSGWYYVASNKAQVRQQVSWATWNCTGSTCSTYVWDHHFRFNILNTSFTRAGWAVSAWTQHTTPPANSN